MADIRYEINKPITPDEFVAVLKTSGLAERRPVDDPECIQKMLALGNLTVSAWQGSKLVGIARSVTDYSYCCYLSDLAVDQGLQSQGVGKQLINLTQEQLGPRATLMLFSAPAAVNYYPHIGMEHHPQAWVLRPGDKLKSV